MNELFLSYDYLGFAVAKIDGDISCPLTLSQISTLIDYASHDLNKGFCKSFQIYGIDGDIIYNSEKQEAA